MSAWIEQQQALCDAATDGPWEADGMDSGHSKFEMSRWVSDSEFGDTICNMDGLGRSRNERVAKDDGAPDAAFIAAARTSLPKALAALREVEDVLVRQWHAIDCKAWGHPPSGPACTCWKSDLRAILATLDEDGAK